MERKAIERAVDEAGSQTKLARAVGVSPQAVQQWVVQGYAPPYRMRLVSSVTGVPVRDLALDFADANSRGAADGATT